MTIRTQSFQYNGATITCRESIGIDTVDDVVIYQKVVYNRQSTRDQNRVIKFADMILRSTVEGDLHLPFATIDSPHEDMQAAYEAFITQYPTALIDQWLYILSQVNKAPSEPEFQPDAEKNDSPPPSDSDAGA